MTGFFAPAWLWLYTGALLMVLELLTPGFVVFFFGLSAATVAGLVALFPAGFTLNWQVAAFSLLSIAYLIGLRRCMKSVFAGDTEATKAIDSEYVGRVGKVVRAIRPEVPGRILLGDAEWSAEAGTRLEPGTEVRITAQKNLTFTVEPLDA